MKPVPVERIADRVRMSRKVAGLKVLDLAGLLGIKKVSYVSGLGTHRPNWKQLPRIAQFCGVSVEWLRDGSPAHAPEWVKAKAIQDAAEAAPTVTLSAYLSHFRVLISGPTPEATGAVLRALTSAWRQVSARERKAILEHWSGIHGRFFGAPLFELVPAWGRLSDSYGEPSDLYRVLGGGLNVRLLGPAVALVGANELEAELVKALGEVSGRSRLSPI